MRTCAIMQPTYLPWLGYFDLLDRVDVFIFLDTVQLSKQSWQVRNRIKTPTGELWLSIPYKKDKGYQQTTLNTAVVNDSIPWRKQHLKSIQNYYRKAPFFDETMSLFEPLLNSAETILSDFTSAMIVQIAKVLGIPKSEFPRCSDSGKLEGTKDALLVNLCKKFQCDAYLSPQGSAAYIEKESPGGAFAKHNITLLYHQYKHPNYPQLFGNFLPSMGIIDLLCNCGFKESLEIIRSGRRESIPFEVMRDKQLRGETTSKDESLLKAYEK